MLRVRSLRVVDYFSPTFVNENWGGGELLGFDVLSAKAASNCGVVLLVSRLACAYLQAGFLAISTAYLLNKCNLKALAVATTVVSAIALQTFGL